MVKVVVSDSQGLVQRAGSGTEIENATTLSGATRLTGLNSVEGSGLIGVVSEGQALSAVKADHDYALILPAGAV